MQTLALTSILAQFLIPVSALDFVPVCLQTQSPGIKKENAVDILKQSSMRAVQFQRPVLTVCPGVMFIFHYL